MIQRRHLALVGALSAATFGTMAFGADASSENLKAEVAALRAELNTMKSGGSWMNDARRDEVKALVKEVLSDADTRASLQGTGATAGYNKGFFIASEDGKFLLQLGGRLQARYIANTRNSQPGGGGSGAPADHNVETGFEMRRTQVWFKGNIGSPKIGYFVRLSANSNTSAVGVDYAYLNYKWSDNLTFTGGRFKAGFSREELVSSGAQMAVERSAVNEAFNVGFTEGIEAAYTTNLVRVTGGVNDGARSGEIGGQAAPTAANAGFLPGTAGNSFQNDTTNYALTGRVDVKLLGDWSSWNEYQSWSGQERSLFVGAGVHFQDSRINQNAWLTPDPAGGAPGRNYDFLMWTTDIGYKANGLSLFASANGHHGMSGGSPQSTQVNTNGGQFSDYGFLAQAGYFVIPDVIEPFIRYEYLTFDRSRNEDIAVAGAPNAGTAHDMNIITAGYNWYFKKNDAKFSLDVVWAIDTVNAGSIGGTSSGTFAGAGLLPDTIAGNNNAENQVAIRAQFQLQF